MSESVLPSELYDAWSDVDCITQEVFTKATQTWPPQAVRHIAEAAAEELTSFVSKYAAWYRSEHGR